MHGEDALFVARRFCSTTAVVKYLGPAGEGGLASVSLNRHLLDSMLRVLLVEEADHVVEMWEGAGASWKMTRRVRGAARMLGGGARGAARPSTRRKGSSPCNPRTHWQARHTAHTHAPTHTRAPPARAGPRRPAGWARLRRSCCAAAPPRRAAT